MRPVYDRSRSSCHDAESQVSGVASVEVDVQEVAWFRVTAEPRVDVFKEEQQIELAALVRECDVVQSEVADRSIRKLGLQAFRSAPRGQPDLSPD